MPTGDADDCPVPSPIRPRNVRYIKLGNGGCWAEQSFEQGYVAFGYHAIPHEVCVAEDWDKVWRLLKDRKSDGARTAGRNEVAAFYEMGDDCLWVTFANGHLWWCFASTQVIWRGGHDGGQPSRYRPTIGSWRNTDICGCVTVDS